MAANPNPQLRSKRAHIHTAVLGQLKKTQQNRAPAWSTRVAATPQGNVLWARGICRISSPRAAHRVFGFMPARSHRNLNISNERAQRPFPKPLVEEWSLLRKRTTITSLCASVRFKGAYCWCFEKIANFFLSFSLLSE
jgi:hypothetical protein